MVSVSTWTSPEIDARIVALKQTGISHAQIAVVICREFRVFTNKNMILRRSRTLLGLDRGEKAANDRLERKRKAERAALEPKAPRPVNVPPPAVTLPPLAFNYQSLMPPRHATPATPLGGAAPVPLGNGKCLFPLWGNEPPTHEYCHKPTPLGSSFCPDCRRICFYRARAA
jgi:hypothetical protein